MIPEKLNYSKPKIIIVLGPTAAGKTKLAVRLALEFNGEIISADSRQVYRGMDIGTGKDLGEYAVGKCNKPHLTSPVRLRSGQDTCKGEETNVPCHLIDVASPKTQFSLAKYQKLAYRAIDDIIRRGKTPILAGGTGLYIQSIVDGMPLLEAKPNWELRVSLEQLSKEEIFKELKKLDPDLDDGSIQGNKRRMIRYIEIMSECKKPISRLWKEQKLEAKYDCLLLGVAPLETNSNNKGSTVKKSTPAPLYKRGELNKKIDKRVDARLKKEGMVEEVERLHKEGVSWKRLESFGLEYKFISQYLQGKLEYEDMVNLLKTATHQFAKRQMTWFKRDKRIRWISGYGEARKEVEKFIRKKNLTLPMCVAEWVNCNLGELFLPTF